MKEKAMDLATDSLLYIEDLRIQVTQKGEPPYPLIHGLDLALPKGKIIGIVGESGSGKSITMKSIMGLLPNTLTSSWEECYYRGMPVKKGEKLPISVIFQDPMTSLNPVRTIGYHLIEVIKRKQKISTGAARMQAVAALQQVGINEPLKRLGQFPHELSGGMRQRIMIAMALLVEPELLIADEPTTALDVTIQAQVLKLIKTMQLEKALTVVLVTHDFGVVAGMCDYVKVMYQGAIIEEGTTDEIFHNPQEVYTKQLLRAADLQKQEDFAVEGSADE